MAYRSRIDPLRLASVDSNPTRNIIGTMTVPESEWLSYEGLLGSDVPTLGTLLADLQLGVFCQPCSRTIPVDRDELTAKHGNRQNIKALKAEAPCPKCGPITGSWRVAKRKIPGYD